MTVKGNYSLLEDAYDDLEEAGSRAFCCYDLRGIHSRVFGRCVFVAQPKTQCQRLKSTQRVRKTQRKLVRLVLCFVRSLCVSAADALFADDYETTLMIPTK